MGVGIYYFYHRVRLKAFEVRHIIRRNKLKNVVHTVLRKGVYHILEFISNEPNKKL